jgi:hypothetical protein
MEKRMADDTPLSAQDPVEAVAKALHGAVAVECGGISEFAGNPARWPWETQIKMQRQDGGKGTHADYYRQQARVAIMAHHDALLATVAAVERERDEALAGIARVEALCDHPSRYTLFGDERENAAKVAVLIDDVLAAIRGAAKEET